MENSCYLSCEIKNIEDSKIRIASSLSIKVLFIIIKYSDQRLNADKISSILKKNADDVEDAIEFWVNLGILKYKNTDKKIKKKEELIENANNFYISKRLKTGKEISTLLDKIETIMRRPLSGADVSLFVKLRDFDGLPSNVIIILVQYCVKMGKTSTRYIEAVGNSWVQDGVNSIESAKEKIKITDKMQLLWKKFEKIIGSNRMPTTKEKEVIYKWFVTWNYDSKIIQEAYDRCINATGKYTLNYMDSIIKTWKNNNICVVDDIEKKSSNNFNYNPTYDISKYENMNTVNLHFVAE